MSPARAYHNIHRDGHRVTESDIWRAFQKVGPRARNPKVGGSEIGDPQGRLWERIEAVPQFRRQFLTADGRRVDREIAVTMARWNGQVLPTLVVFGEEGSQPLLDAYTLEGSNPCARACAAGRRSGTP